MPTPYTIENPQVKGGNGIVELVSTGNGNIQPGAVSIGFLNDGDGNGGGSAVQVGPLNNSINLGIGEAKNYPVIPGLSYLQEIVWAAGGNTLRITVIY